MMAELAARYHEEPERERAWRYLEEERRLAYVGCTRAREHLTITFARTYDRRESEPSTFIAELEKADPTAWLVDRDSLAGVMLPIDVARSARQQALAALGVPGRGVLPTVESDHRGAGGILSTVLAAQWTASQVAGAVPIRFRELPRPFVEQSTLKVSFSGLESYRTCPRQFFYGHVLQVDASVRSAAATLGSKVHAALRSLSHQWMSSGAPPQDEEVQEVWRGTWGVDRSAIKNAIVDPRAHVRLERGFTLPRQLAQAWQAGGGYLRRYYRWERELHGRGSQRIPIALEHSFSLPYRGHFIYGRIDSVIRTPAGDLIIDYKSGKRSGDLQLKSSLQLAIYEKAWRDNGASDAPILGVGYYLLAQDRERSGSFAAWDDKKQLATIRFDEPQREELWRTIDQELAGITANEFAALPVKGKDTCSRCPYSVWCDESLA